MSPLEEKYKMNLELKGYSMLTQKAYKRSIKKYREWYGKSPEFLGTKEIREYLHHLVMESHGSTVDVVYSALKFLYVNTLCRLGSYTKTLIVTTCRSVFVNLKEKKIDTLFCRNKT